MNVYGLFFESALRRTLLGGILFWLKSAPPEAKIPAGRG